MTHDTQISPRKDDHLRLAGQFYAQKAHDTHGGAYEEIDAMQFVPNALPEVNRADVSRETSFAGLRLATPFFINAMTGGTQKTNEINRQLAAVAQETRLPLALGSMSIAVKNPETRAAYETLAKDFPKVQFIANLGAEHSIGAAKFAVDLIGAKALQIHLNAAQEIVMPEGEQDFTGWKEHIAQFVSELDVPVIVKEVGFGLSFEAVSRLLDLGVTTVDVAGKGGTNFIQIENARNAEHNYDYLENWGMTTIRSVLEATHARSSKASSDEKYSQAKIIASGGVRNPLDIVKYLALGADAVGLSAAFLHSVTSAPTSKEGIEQTVKLVRTWDEHIANIMTILGVTSLEDLRKNAHYTLPLSLVEYLNQRF